VNRNVKRKYSDR